MVRRLGMAGVLMEAVYVVLKAGIEGAVLEVREGADLRSSVGADTVTVTALRDMTAIPDRNAFMPHSRCMRL